MKHAPEGEKLHPAAVSLELAVPAFQALSATSWSSFFSVTSLEFDWLCKGGGRTYPEWDEKSRYIHVNDRQYKLYATP